MAELAELLSDVAVAPPSGALEPTPALGPPDTGGRELADLLPRTVDEDARLANSVKLGSELSQEQTARVFKASEKSGLPKKFVEENLDEIERAVEVKSFSPVNFRERSPKFAEWLAKDPRNVAVAKDDVNALTGVERALWSLKTFGKNVYAGAVPSAGAGYWSAARAVAEFGSQFITGPLAGKLLPEDIFGKMAESFGETAAKLEQRSKELEGDLSGLGPTEQAVYGGAQSLGQMLTTLPLAVATKRPVAAYAPLATITAGQSYKEARDAGKGPVEALGLAIPDAFAEIVTERMPVVGILKDVGLKKTFLTTARNWLLKEGLTEQAATLWQDFNNWAVLHPDKPFKDFYLDQRIPRAWSTFVGTVVAGGGMVGVGKAMDVAANRGQSTTVQETNVFRALGEAAGESKLLQKVPAKFREFVAHAKKDGPVDNVYIPVERWDALFQEDAVDYDPTRIQAGAADARQAALELMGDTRAYDEAKAVSGDLVVPIEAYAEKIAGTDIHARLVPDIRLRMGSLSAREDAEIAAQSDDIQALQDDQGKAEFEEDAPIAHIEKEMVDMLRPRYGEAEAQRYAAVEGQRYAARAKRLGVSPTELWQSEGPLVQHRLKADAQNKDSIATQMVAEARAAYTPERVDNLISMYTAPGRSGYVVQAAPEQFLGLTATEFDRVILARSTRPLDEQDLRDTKQPIYLKAQVTDEGLQVIDHEGRHRMLSLQRAGIESVPIVLDLGGQQLSDLGGIELQPQKGAKAPTQFVDAIALTPENRDQLVQMGEGAEVMYQTKGQELGETYFQADTWYHSPGNVIRGQFERAPAGARPLITIFRAANPSTLIHELGHSWLEELRRDAERPDAPQQLKDDWAIIKKWAAIPDALSSDQVIPRASHEMFARSVETYVREGRAPSIELRNAFSRFKDWLLRIYKSAKDLNVEINDEVRGVLDRMLATDEQIERARQNDNMTRPVLPMSDMTTAEADVYQKAVDAARMEAEDEVRVAALNEYARERQAWWKNEKAQLTEEITGELNSQPVYRALSWLRTGLLPDGSEIDGVVPQRLSLQAIRAQYGAPLTGIDPRTLPPFIVAKDGGIHPDVAAEMFGFSTGEELLRALIEAAPKAIAIAAEVDRQMIDRHGDMMNDGSLAERSAEAVHGDKQAEVLMIELRILNRKGAKGKIVPARAMKGIAESMIATKALGEINPGYFERTAAKLGYEAEKAMIEEDFETAFALKSKQVLNIFLTREAHKQKQVVEKALKKWKALDRSDVRLAKTRDVNLVNAARAILATFGVGRRTSSALDSLALTKAYDENTYNDMQEIVAMVTSTPKPLKQLTVDEFAQVKDVVDGLWVLSRLSKQMDIDGMKVSRETVKAALFDRINVIGKPSAKRGYAHAVTSQEKTKLTLLGWRGALRRVESWVDAVDGGNPDGVFRKYIWQPISEAADHFREARKNTLEQYLDIVKSVEKTLTLDKIDAPEIGYKFGVGGRGIFATLVDYGDQGVGSGRAELLGALMHTGNESNLKKLLVGRGWGELREDGTLDRSRWDAFIKRQIDEGVLTKADFDFVQRVWDLMESLKPGAQRAHKAMYGYYFSEVTANQFSTPFGTYRGGYFPAVVDPDVVIEGQLRLDEEALKNQSNSFMFPTTGRGFTKSRVEGYMKPLSLDMRKIPQHLDKVLRFTHIEPRVKDVGRLVMDREFREVLDTQLDPAIASSMLVPWLQRAATQAIDTPSTSQWGRAADSFFRKMRTRTGAQIMVANVTNTLQQFTGIAIAATKVKQKYLRNALWRYLRAPKKTADTISEQSEFMRNRTNISVIEIQKTIDDILLNPNQYEKARDFARKHGYFMQQGTQNIVDLIVWNGAYDQAVETGADTKGAIRQADSAVRQTQGTFAAEDLSNIETGSAGWRAFMMFYSYFNMQANLLGTEFVKATRESGFNAPGRLFYIYVYGFMIPAVVSEAIVQAMSGEMWADDDDDGYLDNFLSIFFGGQVRTATAFVPIVGQALQSIVNRFNDKFYDDRISVSPVVSMIESASNAPFSVYKAVAEDGSMKRAVKDTLTAVGLATGLPLYALGRPLGYMSDVAQGKVEPANAADFIRGLISGRGQ